jgi:hypothetical protein
MTEQNQADEPRPNDPSEPRPAHPAKELPTDPSAKPSNETPPKLTAEEQMALYEEHLKETDWGHQPC